MKHNSLITPYLICAGAMDAGTGILLMSNAGLILAMMGIHHMPIEPVFVNWIGAFVAAVGFTYFLPFIFPSDLRRPGMFTVLSATALIRLGICGFVLHAVTTGRIEPTWLLVSVVDGGTASIQILFANKLRGEMEVTL